VHVMFQPHRFTRTRDLMTEFTTAFDDADTVVMLDIYAASEEPIAGVEATALVKAIGRPGVKYADSFDAGVAMVTKAAQEGDVVLTLGAGNVSGLAPKVLEALAGQ